MRPKILIDGIALLSPLTGVGRYTYEIAKKLNTLNDFKLNYYYGYVSKTLLKPSKPSRLKHLKSLVTKMPLLKKAARETMILFNKIYRPTYDLYWQPVLIPSSSIKAKKTVTSVHDFSFILYRDFHPKERIAYFDKYFVKNIVRSDMIITGSKYTKQEIMQRLEFDESQVKVIYHGINHDLFKIYENPKVDFELPTNFILCVGSIEPRKNLLGLLQAYNLLDENIKKVYKLVLVGFQGWENKEIMDLINVNRENIHYLGFINDNELAKVYNLATLFVFPSFYEGFGLPPLEAMACGTPVISSNLTSMPEIYSNAAEYFDPNNIEEMKNKIALVLKDEELQNDLIARGLERANAFSWERSANEHINLFKEILKI